MPHRDNILTLKEESFLNNKNLRNNLAGWKHPGLSTLASWPRVEEVGGRQVPSPQPDKLEDEKTLPTKKPEARCIKGGPIGCRPGCPKNT